MNNFTGKNSFKFLLLVIAIILLWLLGRYFPVEPEGIQRTLAGFSLFYAGIIFVVLYVVVTFFIWLSKDVFRFVSAILFGAYISTLFVWLAEVINALVLFYFARFLGRSFVEDSLGKRYSKLDERLGKVNFAWLFAFRAVPLVPFRFLDMASGLTRISFKRYLAAVILGSPLRIFWVQYVLAGVGKTIFKDPYALSEYLLANKNLLILSFVYLIGVILVAFKLRAKN